MGLPSVAGSNEMYNKLFYFIPDTMYMLRSEDIMAGHHFP
jgi:hypothetical protein